MGVMDIKDSVLAAIGNTPLIKLRRASEETGCTILGKAEFMNPGHSVKDRAALGIITDAIDKGQLRPGGLIVEGTAGNTGIGLAIVGNALGMKTVIVIPETQAQEKKDTLRALGATLIEVPAVPYKNDNNYVKVAGRTAERLAREHPQGAIFANQFDNVANRDIHVTTTGPEIWEQTGGKVDGFVSAIGTGGTLAGVAIALRERKPDIAIALADVPGAAMHSYYTTGELKAEGSSITEGNRPRPGHRQPRGIRARPQLLHPRRGEPGDVTYRHAQGRGPRARPVVGRQRRRRDPPGPRTRPGQDHRHHAVRPRDAAISRGCSTPNSCDPRALSPRTGSNRPTEVEPDFAPVPAGV